MAVALAIGGPALSETGKPCPALPPANAERMRPFAQPTGAEAKTEIAPGVIEATEQYRAGPLDVGHAAWPHGGQRAAFAKTPLPSLIGGIIVRMHGD